MLRTLQVLSCLLMIQFSTVGNATTTVVMQERVCNVFTYNIYPVVYRLLVVDKLPTTTVRGEINDRVVNSIPNVGIFMQVVDEIINKIESDTLDDFNLFESQLSYRKLCTDFVYSGANRYTLTLLTKT